MLTLTVYGQFETKKEHKKRKLLFHSRQNDEVRDVFTIIQL